jgi:hypothetical protein
MLQKIIKIGFTLLFSAVIHGQVPEKYTISTFAGGMKSLSNEQQVGPAEYAYFGFVLGIAVAPNGDICVADTGRDRICRITLDGKLLKVAGRGRLPDRHTIETAPQKGYRFNIYGKPAFVDGEPASTVDLDFPVEVAADKNGNIYISDTHNNCIHSVDNAGIIHTIAGDGLPGYGGDGGPAKQARLSYPTGLALDSSGNLYIADSANNRIRMVDTKGMIRTIAGNGKSKDGRNGELATKSSLKAYRSFKRVFCLLLLANPASRHLSDKKQDQYSHKQSIWKPILKIPVGFYYSRAWFSADFPGPARYYIYQPISGNEIGSNIKERIPYWNPLGAWGLRAIEPAYSCGL